MVEQAEKEQSIDCGYKYIYIYVQYIYILVYIYIGLLTYCVCPFSVTGLVLWTVMDISPGRLMALFQT